MDPVRGLPSVVQGSLQVNERKGGGSKQQADAFRRALQQGAGDARQQAPEPDEQAAVRRTLQNSPDRSRKNEGTASHVDVFA